MSGYATFYDNLMIIIKFRYRVLLQHVGLYNLSFLFIICIYQVLQTFCFFRFYYDEEPHGMLTYFDDNEQLIFFRKKKKKIIVPCFRIWIKITQPTFGILLM